MICYHMSSYVSIWSLRLSAGTRSVSHAMSPSNMAGWHVRGAQETLRRRVPNRLRSGRKNSGHVLDVFLWSMLEVFWKICPHDSHDSHDIFMYPSCIIKSHVLLSKPWAFFHAAPWARRRAFQPATCEGVTQSSLGWHATAQTSMASGSRDPIRFPRLLPEWTSMQGSRTATRPLEALRLWRNWLSAASRHPLSAWKRLSSREKEIYI